jgi:Flp pilus assembly protein TadB
MSFVDWVIATALGLFACAAVIALAIVAYMEWQWRKEKRKRRIAERLHPEIVTREAARLLREALKQW